MREVFSLNMEYGAAGQRVLIPHIYIKKNDNIGKCAEGYPGPDHFLSAKEPVPLLRIAPGARGRRPRSPAGGFRLKYRSKYVEQIFYLSYPMNQIRTKPQEKREGEARADDPWDRVTSSFLDRRTHTSLRLRGFVSAWRI